MHERPTHNQRDIVILTHGIFSSSWLVRPLARRLARRGFDTRLWSYFTLRGSNRDIGQRWAAYVHQLAEQHPGRTIHLVVHSMGSIVTRCAIAAGLPASVGRIVMIAPPNRGSHVARFLVPIYGWFVSTLKELSDAPDSFVNRLPRVIEGHEIGIIAVTHDRVVQLASTHLDNHRDHVVLDSWHTGVLWREDTADCVERFLRTGRFLPADAPAIVESRVVGSR
jgi:triacylglycerol lipase